MVDRANLEARLRDLVTVANVDDLAELIGALETARATAWARLLAAQARPATTERLIDAGEMGALIGRPAWAVLDLARRKTIPVVEVGRLRKFRASAVIGALESGRRP